MRFDAATAECLVFTYAEGVLAAFAHDLKLRATRFTLVVDDATLAVTASFDTASLRVVAAMQGESERPGALGDADRAEIERTIRDDVLAAASHPAIRFTSSAVVATGSALRVTGTLALHGQTREIVVPVRADGTALVAETTLHKPDFGIVPYRALLGTLRVRPDVRVRVTVPLASPG
jgi:hypothetical protein